LYLVSALFSLSSAVPLSTVAPPTSTSGGGSSSPDCGCVPKSLLDSMHATSWAYLKSPAAVAEQDERRTAAMACNAFCERGSGRTRHLTAEHTVDGTQGRIRQI
jgi:hypothetical protein